MNTANQIEALKVASVADDGLDDVAGAGEPEAVDTGDGVIDMWCEHLAWWVHTRKLYGAPRGPISLLGQLAGTRALVRPQAGRDAACSPFLAALYVAMTQEEGRDRQIFETHYFTRVRNIKVAADQLSIARQSWYVILNRVRARIYARAVEIQRANEEEAAALLRAREVR